MVCNEKNYDFPNENASIFDQTTKVWHYRPTAPPTMNRSIDDCLNCGQRTSCDSPPSALLPPSSPSSDSSTDKNHQSIPRHNDNVKIISIQYFYKLIYYYLLNYNFMKKNYKQYINVTKFKKKMLKIYVNNNNNFKIALAIIIIMFGIIDTTEGGTCWLQRMDNGKCNKLYTKNITKQECCRAGYDVGYTDRDVSQVEAFFADALNDGVACVSCLQNCDTATCGSGKRCILKKGRPKCICAPICKAPKNHNSHNNVKNKKLIQNINVINLSQNHKNFKRHNLNDMTYVSSSHVNSSHHQQHSASLKLEKSNHSKSIKKPNNQKNYQRDVNRDLLASSYDVNHGSVSRKNISKINSESDIEKEHIKNKNRQLFELDVNVRVGRRNQTKKVGNNIRHRRKKNSELTKMLLKNQLPSDLLGIVPYKAIKQTRKNNTETEVESLETRFRSGLFEKSGRNNNNHHQIINDNSNHGNYFNPVCGTDGKTYKTECQLKKRACRQESTTLTVAYRGHCQTSCRFVQCALGKQCVEDQYSTPHCVECLKLCPSEKSNGPKAASKLVCGIDGVTYKNLCELKQKACLTGRTVQVAYKGACNEEAHCDNIICKDRQTCLPDLMTNQPRCVSCSFKCPRWRRPQGTRPNDMKLCGSNNHSYHSWCQMVKDSCTTGFYIDVKHNGTCVQDETTEPPAASLSTLNADDQTEI